MKLSLNLLSLAFSPIFGFFSLAESSHCQQIHELADVNYSSRVLPPLQAVNAESGMAPALSGNFWFRVVPKEDSLQVRYGSSGIGEIETVELLQQRPGVHRYVVWSQSVNAGGIGAATLGLYSPVGEKINGVLISDYASRSTKIVLTPNYFPHQAAVDGSGNVWVTGAYMQSLRDEAGGDFPLIRVYNNNGRLLAEGLQKSKLGGSPAFHFANRVSRGITAQDEYLVHLPGSGVIYMLSLNSQKDKILEEEIQTPTWSKDIQIADYFVCGKDRFLLSWKSKQGGAGMLELDRKQQSWRRVMISNEKSLTQNNALQFCGCSTAGEPIARLGLSTVRKLVRQ